MYDPGQAILLLMALPVLVLALAISLLSAT
jgi:hypothetical protein